MINQRSFVFNLARYINSAVHSSTIIMMSKFAIIFMIFPIVLLWYQFTFLFSVVISLGIYLVFGGWKFIRIIYYTFPRDFRAGLVILNALRKMKKMAKQNKGIPDIFKENVKRHPHKIAFIEVDGKEWTYQQVEDYSNQVANYLYNQGYQKGDTVALFMHNCPEYVCIWLGMVKIGVIPALINFNLRMSALSHSINIVNCKGVVFTSDLISAMTDVKLELKSNINGYYLGENSNTDACHLDPELETSSKLPTPRDFLTNFNEKLLYIYTSGTTGLPKAAVITHSRFFYMAYGLHNVFKLNCNSIIYDTLPLYHTAGGILGIGQVIVCGATTVIRKKFSASKFWDDCIKYNCTACQYIGEICRYLLAQPQKSIENRHKIEIAFGNGLRPQIWKEFMKRFNIKRIGEFYGATEGNANIANTDNKVGAVGFMSVIIPSLYPIRLIKVDPATGVPLRDRFGLCIACKPGEQGEMVGKIIKNDPLRHFDGYANKDATEKKIAYDVFQKGDSAFLTGDVLEMDEFGYVYFKDRTGDTFRWKGENVSTAEVEATISNIIKLNDAVAYGVEIPGQEGRAGMVAIADQENKLDLVKLYHDLQLMLPVYARPIFIRKLKNVDTTGTFKLKKTDYRNDAFNITKIKDPIYFLDHKQKDYTLLTKDIYEDILNGQIRF